MFACIPFCTHLAYSFFSFHYVVEEYKVVFIRLVFSFLALDFSDENNWCFLVMEKKRNKQPRPSADSGWWRTHVCTSCLDTAPSSKVIAGNTWFVIFNYSCCIKSCMTWENRSQNISKAPGSQQNTVSAVNLLKWKGNVSKWVMGQNKILMF